MGVSGCDRVFVCYGEVVWVCLLVPQSGWNVCDIEGLCGGVTGVWFCDAYCNYPRPPESP